MDSQFGSVSRRTEAQIESLARLVRQELGVEPNERIAMQPILEFALDDMVDGAYLAIENDAAMEGAEGRTDWHRPVITLSASSYADLRRSSPRARMTAAHELGHLLMHTKQPIYYYRSKARDQRFDPEWQADYFAAALLMPSRSIQKMKTVKQVMSAFGVSRGAALRRARGLNVVLFDDLASHQRSRKKGHGMNRAP